MYDLIVSVTSREVMSAGRSGWFVATPAAYDVDAIVDVTVPRDAIDGRRLNPSRDGW